MKDYFEYVIKTIKDSLMTLDYKNLDLLINNCIQVLNSHHKIIVTGLGKNVPICEKFVGTMLSLGLDATFIHTNTAIHGDLGAVHDGDLVIILSKSGETAESIYLFKELQKRKIAIWAMTFNKNSTLATESSNHLDIQLAHEGDKWDIVPNNSTTIYLIILQSVAIELSKRMDLSLDDFKKNHPGGHIGVLLNGHT